MALSQSEYEKLFSDSPTNTTKDIGVAQSMAAGLGSGIFKIFEGAATLAATLMDLGVDKDRAEAVELFFEKINPFDEAAEATAAGKITELIVNIGIPGGVAFKIGSGLTKAALRAKEAGTYLSRGEKVKRFGKGALSGGVAEGIFVGDVEDAGSFGDLLGGPTELDRETGNPETELLNRLKFGLEGAAFTGALGAGVAGVKKLRSTKGTGKVIEDPFDKWVDRWISRPLRSRGQETPEAFDLGMKRERAIGVDLNLAENAMIDIDNITDRLVKNVRHTIGRKATKGEKDKLLKEMNEILLSNAQGKGLKPIVDEVGAVKLGDLDTARMDKFKETLKNTYKATDEDIASLDLAMNGMRLRWEKLFSSMGGRLTAKSVEEFQRILPKRINDAMDRGYEIFKNNQGRPKQNGVIVMENYKPTKAVLNTAIAQLIKIADDKGMKLSLQDAKRIAENIVETAELPKGFKLNEGTGVLRADFPDFIRKSVADYVTDPLQREGKLTAISELTGVARPVINQLLGKSKNILSTIVEGTNNLSAQIRTNEYYDSLLKKSDEMKIAYDDWVAGGKIGAAPRPPMFVNSPTEAAKYFGGNTTDWKMIGEKAIEPSAKVDGKEVAKTRYGGLELYSKGYLDPDATLKPLTASEEIAKVGEDILTPLQGKWALVDTVDALRGVDEGVKKSMPLQLYQNLILYPKATAQMAKTILAPFTHARNFISAAAFAGANGILPFGNVKDVKAAWNALQLSGPGMRKNNEFYQELLDLGVVNTQVQLGDLKRLLKDVDFGATLNNVTGLNGFLKKLSKAKKFAQDAYTAEDDFWKIFTYLGEKSRMYNAYRNAGLREGQEFIDPKGVKRRFNEDAQWLKEASADLVKNNVPNYAYVSEFIKGLRKLPVGNFVAFPAEIMRTGTNIVSTALDEIFYTTTINGKQVNPLRGRGMQRLMGMGLTTAAVPLATVSAMQAIYDVSKDELDAMRRYVPSWSKNSTLIPFKDEEGKLSYVDFSHLNAYDTLTRPIQTVLNAVNEGRTDKDGIMDDFLKGLIESTTEIGSPFFTEAIWTEALQDVAPILGRDGMSKDGRKIWNDKDSPGDKMSKAIAHLVEAQAPFNWKQLGRLGLAMYPVDNEGQFDDRGNEYELGNELAGIAGLRRVDVDPAKSIRYKINLFQKGIRDSRQLFTSATLKGGPITPEEIVDAYINANRATFEVNRELYKDVEAARLLGMGEGQLEESMDARGAGAAYNYIGEGEFRPFTPSRNIIDLFEDLGNKLGISNPYDAAESAIDRIRDILETVPLGGEFPDIINPLKTSMIPNLPTFNNNTAGLPPLPNPGLVNNTQFGNIDQVTGLTLAEEIYLDPLSKAYRKNQRKPKQNQTKLT